MIEFGNIDNEIIVNYITAHEVQQTPISIKCRRRKEMTLIFRMYFKDIRVCVDSYSADNNRTIYGS